MKNLVISLCILFCSFNNSYSQIFSQDSFKFNGVCSLQIALNTVDDNNNKITVYQCVNQTPASITVYRINVIAFKTTITDTEEYYRSLKKKDSNLGTTTSTTLKGKEAVQLIEDVTVEGHSMKQISVSTLYKNKAMTLVLVTNSSSYSTLLSNFKNQFSFL